MEMLVFGDRLYTQAAPAALYKSLFKAHSLSWFFLGKKKKKAAAAAVKALFPC